MLSNILEHHGCANQHLASLEEDLVHSRREEEKLKATIEALEKEKREMNARVALMERKDLYELLEAKMEGFQIANHPRMIGVFEYMRSIFDSYVNPTNDPNVQPLEKDADADDFSVDKFFGLQDPTSPDDAQASLDFEDLRTNERVRLRSEFTKASELVVRYDKPNHAEEAMIKITCLRKSICLEFHDEDMQGNLPMWIFVPIHGNNHWSLAIIRIHNDVAMLAHLDSFRYDPEAIFYVLRTVLCLIVPIDPALVMTGIMNIEQQQDGHSCGKHVLQMLAGAAKKESKGLDRCFREEGLRYIATLDQVRSFDVLFPMYLSGKLPGPPM
ncbi:hypothetical protein R1flu_014388 [Riccia fluitans]|uniref:Ubiquitin-like protease family profile domain-containing protein n=1 Tax=Riccia fluitans TaxID=41844 RepID=A0ABD1YG30_9MARC